ncbi:MAG: hypothetical protein CGW95_06600 [Phenylobacterium zucineum]|nr:MAG: hypothetical protein CGW95_06600 [Phenylobacterium zucineum]
MSEAFDTDEAEDLDLMQICIPGQPVSWAGITRPGGNVYLQGDIHVLGSATALIKAAKEHVPYVPVSAVQVLFPAEWLAAECLHDADRLRVIANLSAFVRGQ